MNCFNWNILTLPVILSDRKVHNINSVTGGDAALTDEITADGQAGISFMHPMGEIFLQPLAGERPSLTHHHDNMKTMERIKS